MKVKILMTALVATLLLGVQSFASPYPCDSACVDPCGSCDSGVVKCDLFAGLKKLVSGVRFSSCDPCEAVEACSPCDEVLDCGPCDDVCGPKFTLGSRLRGLFASSACSPCDDIADCGPCDVVDCDPCGDTSCGPKFSLRSLNPFKKISWGKACATECDPCAPNGDCDPCDPCDTGCGPRACLIDLPRVNLKKLFSGLRCSTGCNDVCSPCDEVRPCDSCF